MPAKDIKKAIITLVILAVGINILAYIAKGFTSGSAVPGLGDVTSSVSSLTNLFSIGIAILIIFLVPFYLSKRSQEKKYGEQAGK